MPAIDKEEIGNRLVELQKYLKFKSSRQFAMELNADPGYFAKAQKGQGLSMDHLELIIEKYKISRNWLLSGEGDIHINGVNTPREASDDYKDNYIAMLEKTLREQKKIIKELELKIRQKASGQGGN